MSNFPIPKDPYVWYVFEIVLEILVISNTISFTKCRDLLAYYTIYEVPLNAYYDCGTCESNCLTEIISPLWKAKEDNSGVKSLVELCIACIHKHNIKKISNVPGELLEKVHKVYVVLFHTDFILQRSWRFSFQIPFGFPPGGKSIHWKYRIVSFYFRLEWITRTDFVFA
jgi:hypothetical protein